MKRYDLEKESRAFGSCKKDDIFLTYKRSYL